MIRGVTTAMCSRSTWHRTARHPGCAAHARGEKPPATQQTQDMPDGQHLRDRPGRFTGAASTNVRNHVRRNLDDVGSQEMRVHVGKRVQRLTIPGVSLLVEELGDGTDPLAAPGQRLEDRVMGEQAQRAGVVVGVDRGIEGLYHFGNMANILAGRGRHDERAGGPSDRRSGRAAHAAGASSVSQRQCR